MKKDKKQEFAILKKFVEVYCNHHHGTNGEGLCDQCNDLLAYGNQRLERCPYDPKPKCKDCETYCYRPKYRQNIKEIMKYSGMHFVKRGRIDWLIKYFAH